MESVNPPVWVYKPITARRRSVGPLPCGRTSPYSRQGSLEPTFKRSNFSLLPDRRTPSYYGNTERKLSGKFRNSGEGSLLDPGASLSAKIADFLHRTDYIGKEWRKLEDKKGLNHERLSRSQSATNILIKGFQYLSRGNSVTPSLHDDTLSEAEEISELAVDLAEEHSACAYATDRLDAEKSERLRLEKELQLLQVDKKRLEENTEKLELELVCARTVDINGIDLESDDGEQDSVSRERYERVLKELEYTKRRMHQQHEHDIDQLVGLRKQLEKKLADSYEELEEQRQVVAQWKRKANKLNAELSDVKLLLEEQNARNSLLEKKQRKFDAEIQSLTEEFRQEKLNKERLQRERDLVLGDKLSLESNLSSVKLELELKEQQNLTLSSELNEIMSSGNTEEDVTLLKKMKHQLESKVKEQEEELDDLAGHVQLLEQAKLKLEMSLEQVRKENRRELTQRDDELDEIRANAHKKVKVLECQLEAEHEQRTLLLRERHEMERRLTEAEENLRQTQGAHVDLVHKLKKDLKKTKALFRDAQITIQQSRTETPNKVLLRQLRNQLEDMECARAAAVKAKLSAEAEVAELTSNVEDAIKAKQEAEEKLVSLNRELSNLQLQFEENEEEMAEVLMKYRSTVSQLSSGQISLQEQTARVAELESERASLKEQVAELQSRLENLDTLNDPMSSFEVKKYVLKTKELESKLELEQTTKTRMEVQMARLRDTAEKAQSEMELARAREQSAQENARKMSRSLREAREEVTLLTQREEELSLKRKELEKRLEASESETAAARADLRLAMQRIEDLQCAIQGDLEDLNASNSDSSASDLDSSDDSVATFQSRPSINLKRSDTGERDRIAGGEKKTVRFLLKSCSSNKSSSGIKTCNSLFSFNDIMGIDINEKKN